MGRQRHRSEWAYGELNLTAMIDVAFQLLAFFIIAVRPTDVLAFLNVYRPTTDVPPINRTVPSIRVTVLPERYAIDDRVVDIVQLESSLRKCFSYDRTATILIMCANASPHEKLVAVLDLCAKVGLTNLAVVSSGGY